MRCFMKSLKKSKVKNVGNLKGKKVKYALGRCNVGSGCFTECGSTGSGGQ